MANDYNDQSMIVNDSDKYHLVYNYGGFEGHEFWNRDVN